ATPVTTSTARAWSAARDVRHRCRSRARPPASRPPTPATPTWMARALEGAPLTRRRRPRPLPPGHAMPAMEPRPTRRPKPSPRPSRVRSAEVRIERAGAGPGLRARRLAFWSEGRRRAYVAPGVLRALLVGDLVRRIPIPRLDLALPRLLLRAEPPLTRR